MNTNTTTDNPRLSHLNTQLGDCKPYAAFVACAIATGHTWATDADLAAFEDVVGQTLKWDMPLERWGQLWLVAASHVLDRRLDWVSPSATKEKEIVVDIPTSEGGYFADDQIPGLTPKQCICRVPDAGACYRLRCGESYDDDYGRSGCECECACHYEHGYDGGDLLPEGGEL